jgi:predicted transcriptional regulator
MQTLTIKENVKTLVDSLPDNLTYDDVMYEIYVKQKIEKGLDDIEKGNVLPREQAKKLFAC